MATRVRDGRLLRILTGAIAIAWSGGWGAFGFAQADGDANGFLPAAEERLEQGETAAAFAAYRAEFDAANSISGRLGRIGSLARVALVNGGLVSFFEDLPGQEWEQALLRAAIRQFLEDLPGALSEVAEIEASGVPAEIRPQLFAQMRLWAEWTADAERLLPLARNVFETDPTAENHVAYVSALLEAGDENELLHHLSGRTDSLAAEADFWRSRFPELQRRGWLEKAAGVFVPVWESGGAEALFALGELRVFLGGTERAREIFWRVFELEEQAEPGDGFRRLNAFFHSRFAVMNRIGQTDGRYGTDGSREFAFFGLREDVLVRDVSSARDAALNYLRELELGDRTSREFLQRIRQALDRHPRPAGQRILAFAQAGAPRWMLEEIEYFVRAPGTDTATAEFALLAINRLVLSTDKFPELGLQMRDLARALEEKLDSPPPQAVAERNRELRERIQRRLGFDVQVSEAEQVRQSVFERISAAVENGNPAEAERAYRELEETEEPSPDLLLYLAEAWLRAGKPEEAAALVHEVLRGFYDIRLGAAVPVPLVWSGRELFVPNPWHGEQAQERLYRTFQVVSESPEAQAALEQIWADHREIPGVAAVEALFWRQAEERERVLAAARRLRVFSAAELQLFAAHLLAVEGETAEAETVLQTLAETDGETADRARQFRFGLTVFHGNSAAAAELAGRLEEQMLSDSEKVRVAAGLESVGETGLAAAWLERVDLQALFGRDEAEFRLVRLKVLRALGDRERAEGFARTVLLGGFPQSFYELGTPLRTEALETLEELGRLEDFERELEELAAAAPGAFPVHLLLGESAQFRGERDRAKAHFSAIAEAAPDAGELQLELAEWLAANGFPAESVAQYGDMLERDAVSTLLDLTAILRAYRGAGELERLVVFMEAWEAPEAGSLDRFYGLQPTAHIFEALGRQLRETGRDELAVRAWEKGLAVNPIEFTGEMRVALAELYRERGEVSEIVGLVKNYVAEANPDPELYWQQPFASVVPRWIHGAAGEAGFARSPIGRLLETAEEAGAMHALDVAADHWRREMPDRFSVAVFDVYLAFRAEREGWREELEALERQFADSRGPVVNAWKAAENLFAFGVYSEP